MFCLGLRFVSYLGLKTCLLIWSTEISGGAFIRNSLTRLLLDHFYGIFSSHPTPLSQHLLRYGGFSLRSKRFRLVSKERKTEEGDFRFWLREKWNESHKIKEGGGGGERRKRLQTNPSILKTCVRQRTQRLIGSASRTILTCVDQRFVSYWSGRFSLQRKSIFINFVWNAKLFLRLYKGFRSLNLFSKVSPGSE